MSYFRVIVDFFGDLATVELAIDELISGIPVTELDSVDIVIRNEGSDNDA